MAILNNLRDIKSWISSSSPATVPPWQSEVLLRSVPEKSPRLVIPVTSRTVPSEPSMGSRDASNERNTSNSNSFQSSNTSNISKISEQQRPFSGSRNDPWNRTKEATPSSIGNGSNLQKENPAILKTPHQKIKDTETLFMDPLSDSFEVIDADPIEPDTNPIEPDANPIRPDVKCIASGSQTPIVKPTKRHLESNISKVYSSSNDHGSSTRRDLSSEMPEIAFSIIDPDKLGLTDLLNDPIFKEPSHKKPKLGAQSITRPISLTQTQPSLINMDQGRGTISSYFENKSKQSQTKPSPVIRQVVNTSQANNSSVCNTASTNDTDVGQLQNYIRLCEARIELLIKKNAINDSTSLSLDAKLLWIRNKFEPRMLRITSEVNRLRPSFTFLKASTDENNLSNVNSDADASQFRSPFVVTSSPPESTRHKVFTAEDDFDDLEQPRTMSKRSETLLLQDTPKLPTNFSANIEEARRIIQENKARTQNKNYAAVVDDEDDDLEDDFGAEYLGGLVSSPSNDQETDLSGFVVSDEEGGGGDDFNTIDGTYLGTQETQQDSDNDSDAAYDDNKSDAVEPIQDELQDLLSQNHYCQSSPGDQVAIEISDEEDIANADFTTQLNENRDDIVHIPSEDELDDDDLNGLRELLHVKLEQSQRILLQIISESDFSDDDDELIQLTKNVLPSSSDPNTLNHRKESQKPGRRVIPGLESFIDEIYHVLNKTFGLKSFRPNQLEAVVSSLQGNDVFVLLPTGGGKSLCFQLPALVHGGKTSGVTVVVSPLISLMQDQVQHLREKNIRADMISSKGTADERNASFKSLTTGQLDLVYLSPEMINNSGRVQKVIEKLHENDMLARVVVDEAHCVSSWGHDFRPDYKGMKFFKEKFPNVPVMALTATASEKVRLDIIHNLKMQNPVMLKQSFNRTNLFYTVMNKPPGIYEWIRNFVTQRHRGQTGIIYCHSKQSCETTAQKLNEYGISCMFYHAGMNPDERLDVQLQWQNNSVQLICATIAFGMGIDKPDVRFVIHMYIPRSLEGYYQETGRAGRDGQESECIMFYSYKDARSLQSMIQRDSNLEERARDVHLSKLRQVVQYCENKSDCRRRQVLHYFNETFDAKNCLKKCDNCCSNITSITRDMTAHCINIIKMIEKIQGDKVTVIHCQDVYKGSKSKKIVTLGHTDIEYHGLGKDLDRGDIERMIFELQNLNALAEYQVMRAGFATSYIRLGSDANVVLSGRKKIYLSFAQEPSSKVTPKSTCGPKLTASGNGAGLDTFRYTDSFVSAREYRNQSDLNKENILSMKSSGKIVLPIDTLNGAINDSNGDEIELVFNELRNFRQQKLHEKGFARPNFYVSDALLKEMAVKLPTNARDFAKLENVPKGQTSCFGDFKSMLASLARARKSGNSQSYSTRPTGSQSSLYFQPQNKRSQKTQRNQRLNQFKSKSRGTNASQNSRQLGSSSHGLLTSKFIRQMPL